jgi:hypothetical protein
MTLRRAGILWLTIATLVTAFALAEPASAGDELPNPMIKVSRHRDGPFRLSIEPSIGVDQKKTYFFKVKNTENQNGHVTLSGAESNADFRFRYFRGNNEITEAVQNDNYELELNALQAKLIRMTAKQKANPPAMACAFLRNWPSITALATVRFNGDTCG